LLLQRFGELQRERASEDIVRAARRERNDHADGFGRIILRERVARRREQGKT